jgi:O-acetyl-ADP-ribose deacetylase (regulator of RNase III)
LREECATLEGCPTGETKITKGYRLLARFVIHTVGPIWRGGSHSEPELLSGCYRSCFAVAYQHDLKSLAFPSISAGAYPVEKASVIALRKIQLAIKQYPEFEKIIVACFDQKRWRFTRKPKAGRHRNYDSSLASSVNLRESTSLFVVPPVQLLPFL